MHRSLKVVTWVGRVKKAFGTLAFIGQSIEYRNYTSVLTSICSAFLHM